MRHVIGGEIIEVPVDDFGQVSSKAVRIAAGIPDDRPLIVKMPNGSNVQVNPDDDVMLQPGQEFHDAPVHIRGVKEPDITVPVLVTIGRLSATVQTECKSE